jgi:flavin-dependent dehydrogenase
MLRILGGGPAGASAAIAALQEGSAVRIYEQSRGPRHKVCGEFLSPEARPLLARLGVIEECNRASPATITRLVLHFGSRERRARLPEPAWGLSRYRLDQILLDKAAALGATLVRERCATADILACGRRLPPDPGERLFGFKAHFRGPVDDAVELYFFDGGYAGVSTVENGVTNVCGLVREGLLRLHAFEPDALLASCPPLANRLNPLTRAMDWLITGPVGIGRRDNGAYAAGDALGFIDPFTGSGILNALLTGSLAGTAAARRIPPAAYAREAQRLLSRPFLCASAFRAVLQTGWVSGLASLVPAAWLYRLTRPRPMAA